jgi:hypothetical protein
MNNLTSFFVPINDVIGYQPPRYIPGWDGSFKKIKIGKSNYFRPNKEFSKCCFIHNFSDLVNLGTGFEKDE